MDIWRVQLNGVGPRSVLLPSLGHCDAEKAITECDASGFRDSVFFASATVDKRVQLKLNVFVVFAKICKMGSRRNLRLFSLGLQLSNVMIQC